MGYSRFPVLLTFPQKICRACSVFYVGIVLGAFGQLSHANEVKIVISDKSAIAQAKKEFELVKTNAWEETVYFFDTPKRDLYKKGIVLRARFSDEGVDTTVKLRPVKNRGMFSDFDGSSGFKCEKDISLSAAVDSCSLTKTRNTSQIESVIEGDEAMTKLFSSSQEEFLAVIPAWNETFYDKLTVIGPIQSWEWEYEEEGFQDDLTFALWKLPSGREILEFSTRVVNYQQSTLNRMTKYLESSGVGYSRQGGKTGIALGVKDNGTRTRASESDL